MKKLLIVDVRLLAYETYHKRLNFTNFFSIVANETLKYINPNRIIWAYDSKLGSIKRKTLYPEYKAHRKERIKTTAEKNKFKKFNSNYDKLQDILPYLGNLIHLDGIEADDIANLICEIASDKYEIYMLSSDKDWIVNITKPNIKQIHLKRGLVDINNAEQIFGISPDNVIKVQALAGITKENVKGVWKLGDTRVYKWLKEGKTIDEIIDMVQEYVDLGKYGMKLPDGYNSVRELYNFNYEVLRPFTLSDLTEDEKALMLKQINHKEKITISELELKLIETYNSPLLINSTLKSFYKLS